jgi:Interferon-induced transmembrane protein
VTQQEPDREDDWGSSTDWQQSPQQPPPVGPGWAPGQGNVPQQGYAGPGYGSQPNFGPPPGFGPPSGFGPQAGSGTPPRFGPSSPYQPVPSWPAQPGWPSAAPPPNYLGQAVLVTLLCFLPTGIAAIYFSGQVGTRHNAGDYSGAVDASNKAKLWCWISGGAGVVLWLVVVAQAGTSSTGFS